MVEPARGLRLAREALAERLRLDRRQAEPERLDRDDAVDQRILRLVDDTHAAAGERLEHFVAADLFGSHGDSGAFRLSERLGECPGAAGAAARRRRLALADSVAAW